MPSPSPNVPSAPPLQPSRLAIPGVLLLALMAFLGAPDRHIAAAECGGDAEVLCKETQICRASILFLNRCTTTYDYWDGRHPDDDGDREEEPDDGSDESGVGDDPA